MTALRFELCVAADAAGLAPALLELQTHANEGAAPVVRQALALKPLLPLLCAVEQWTDQRWSDVHPAVQARHWPGDQAALTIDISGLGRLALPWAQLRPGQALQAPGFELTWPAWPCEWLLEQLPAAAVEPAALASGSLLLLPAAFAAPWHWRLRATARDAPAWAAPDTPGAPWHVCARSAAPVSLEHWFGLPQQPPPPEAPAELRLHDTRGSGPGASGRLRRLGSGHALQISAWT